MLYCVVIPVNKNTCVKSVNKAELFIRNMRRDELDILVDWAAAEGWNPGLSDAGIFWATDPDGFIAAEIAGEMVGGGSIISYGGQYGFMGFFIMHPDHRGRGLGNLLWHERLQRLISRLQKPAIIGMDGVFDMQAYYTRGGFEFSGRDLRFEGRGQYFPDQEGVIGLDGIPFEEVDTYDQAHFPAPRSVFLRRWIDQPGAHARAMLSDGQLSGYGVIRPCRHGHKIGPLFANDAEIADRLFRTLSTQVAGESIFLDVPECNPAAIELARRYQMEEVFGCAKMYFGPRPVLAEQEIFGVTTFELG